MMQEDPRFVHGGNVYEPTADGEPWLDFSANINPLGLSPRVKEAIIAHIEMPSTIRTEDARAAGSTLRLLRQSPC